MMTMIASTFIVTVSAMGTPAGRIGHALVPPAVRIAHTSSSCSRRCPCACCVSDLPWSVEEDAALVAAVPAFTVGKESNVATFWSALAISTSGISSRSPAECVARMAAIAADATTVVHGPQPPVLSSWERVDGGKYTGTIDGLSVWFAVVLEGRLASDPRDGPGYIEAAGGRILELGEERRASVDLAELLVAPAADRQASSRDSPASRLADELRASLLASVCFLGFFFGANGGLGSGDTVPPPLPDPPARVFISAPRGSDPMGGSLPSQQQEQPVRVALTLPELIARQQLRIAAEKLTLSRLESSVSVGELDAAPEVQASRGAVLELMRADGAKLAQLRGVEATFGTGASLYQAGLDAQAQEANAAPARWVNGSPGMREVFALDSTLGARTLEEQVGKQVQRTRNLAMTLAQADSLESTRAGAAESVGVGLPAGPGLRRARLELSYKWAQQSLGELRRVEAERGGQSAPVVMGQWVEVTSAEVVP